MVQLAGKIILGAPVLNNQLKLGLGYAVALHQLLRFQEVKPGYLLLQKLSTECAQDVKNGSKACLCGSILANVSKNRYKNILPCKGTFLSG